MAETPLTFGFLQQALVISRPVLFVTAVGADEFWVPLNKKALFAREVPGRFTDREVLSLNSFAVAPAPRAAAIVGTCDIMAVAIHTGQTIAEI